MFVFCLIAANAFSDSDFFHLIPMDYPLLSNEDCLENLKNIIRSIISYYDKTRGWELESNIPLSNIFLKYAFFSSIEQ